MSISISIDGSAGRPDESGFLVPLASTRIFRRDWLPACSELGLEMLTEAFDMMITVPPAERPRLLRELQSLVDYWAAEGPGGPCSHHATVVTRAIQIIETEVSEEDVLVVG